MSRVGWAITLCMAVALLLMPGFLERWRRVRRAMGAVVVFWISMNLWGTAVHVSSGRPSGTLRGFALMGPPLLLAAGWVLWDLRRKGRA
jgi:hypothetical protein